MKTIGLKNTRSGFTLIEIIIVIVILGILAAVALPRITANIDTARGAEAMAMGGDIIKAFNRCATEAAGTDTPDAASATACNSWAKLGLADPGAASTNFTYTISQPGATTTLQLLARGKYTGAVATDTITFSFNVATGVTTKGCGTGKFKGVCKN